MSHRIHVLLLTTLLAAGFVAGPVDAASDCDSIPGATFDAPAASAGLLALAVDECPEVVVHQAVLPVPSRDVEVIETLVSLPGADGAPAALFRLQRANGSPLAEVAVAPPTRLGEVRRFETVVRWYSGGGAGRAIVHAADRYEVVTDPDPEEGGHEEVTDPDPEKESETDPDPQNKLLGPEPSRSSEWRFVLALDATITAEDAHVEILGWLVERLWVDHQSPPGPGGIRLVGFAPIR